MGKLNKLTNEEILSYINKLDMKFSQYNYQYPKIDDTSVCPICRKHIQITLFNHMILERDDQQHLDFLKQEINKGYLLFFDTTMHMNPSRQDLENRGIYIASGSLKDIWTTLNYEKRKELTRCIAKSNNHHEHKTMYCPICDTWERSIINHVKKIKDKQHIEFIKHQEEYAKMLFWNLDVNKNMDLKKIGMYLSFTHMQEIQHEVYSDETFEEHRKRITGPKLSKIFTGRKLSQKQVNTIKQNNEKNNMNFSPFKQMYQDMLNNEIIPIFDEYPLPKNITNYNLNDGICPICGEKFKQSLWNHLRFYQNDPQHIPFLHEQMRLVIKLFYNLSYFTDKQNDDIGLYFSFRTCRETIWPVFFTQEELKLRINKEASLKPIHKKAILPQTKNWKFVREGNYHCDKRLQVDWNQYKNMLPLDKKYEQDFIKSVHNHICPICKKHFNREFFVHLKMNRKDKQHLQLFEEQIQIAKLLFNELHYNKYTFHKYNERFLSNYRTCEGIWECLYDPDIFEERSGKSFKVRGYSKYSKFYGYRKDIDLMVYSTWEANIYRIIQYELGYRPNWKRNVNREINFDISTPDKQKTYRVDLLDEFGIFSQPNTYVEIKGQRDEKAIYAENMFKQLYPDKHLIIIGIPRDDFQPDINYRELEKQYKPLIPLWEDNDQNIVSHPDLYIPKQILE